MPPTGSIGAAHCPAWCWQPSSTNMRWFNRAPAAGCASTPANGIATRGLEALAGFVTHQFHHHVAAIVLRQLHRQRVARWRIPGAEAAVGVGAVDPFGLEAAGGYLHGLLAAHLELLGLHFLAYRNRQRHLLLAGLQGHAQRQRQGIALDDAGLGRVGLRALAVVDADLAGVP